MPACLRIARRVPGGIDFPEWYGTVTNRLPFLSRTWLPDVRTFSNPRENKNESTSMDLREGSFDIVGERRCVHVMIYRDQDCL